MIKIDIFSLYNLGADIPSTADYKEALNIDHKTFVRNQICLHNLLEKMFNLAGNICSTFMVQLH